MWRTRRSEHHGRRVRKTGPEKPGKRKRRPVFRQCRVTGPRKPFAVRAHDPAQSDFGPKGSRLHAGHGDDPI